MRPDLRPLSDRQPPPTGRQVRGFLCIRNESVRLPAVLEYYRQAGVDWFFVIDNDSTDGSTEFLLSQPDCSVFSTRSSFADSNFGMDWINALLEQHGIGHWRLFVDADELFVYPYSEDVTLPELCRYLEDRRDEGVYAFMMDMYSAGPIADAEYRAGQKFIDVCPLFDPDYQLRRRVGIPGLVSGFPPMEFVGGPRLRSMYPEFVGKGPLSYAIPRGFTKLRGTRLGYLLDKWPWIRSMPSPPLLSKMPLTFGSPGRVYVNNHRTTPLRLSQVTGVLLHFKFFADFHQRVATALAEGQHFDGGSEYARYAAALRANAAVSLAFPGSVRYRNSEDLLDRGLLRTDPDYASFRAERIASRQAKYPSSRPADAAAVV